MASSATAQITASGVARKAAVTRARGTPRWRRNAGLALLAVALVGVALARVWLRLQVVQMGYVLSTASKLQSQLEQEQRELRVEFATLTSPDRLEALARTRLGLVPPEKGQVIVLP